MPRKKHIRYDEGQWFAVPLNANGYALGIIVRGSYRRHGGLGYFFGLQQMDVPDEAATRAIEPQDAVLIAWFGDLGIIEGRWPLVESRRPFRRQDWPIPRFGNAESATHGWLTEYDQDSDGFTDPTLRKWVPIGQLSGLPEDGVSGYLAVEGWLSQLLQPE